MPQRAFKLGRACEGQTRAQEPRPEVRLSRSLVCTQIGCLASQRYSSREAAEGRCGRANFTHAPGTAAARKHNILCALNHATERQPVRLAIDWAFGGGARTGIRPALKSTLERHWRAGLVVLLLGASALAGYRFAGLPQHKPAAAVAPYPHELAQVSFAVAGDVIPHEAVRAAAIAGGEGAHRAGRRYSATSPTSFIVPISRLSISKRPSPRLIPRGPNPSCSTLPSPCWTR